jgi:hypothetical protein
MSLRGCSRFLAILARLFALAGLGVMATAITLGQRNPPKPAHRSLRPDRLFWISGRIIGDDVNSRFFDAESGQTVPITVPEESELQLASGSPWREEDGTRHVVGVCMRRHIGVRSQWNETSLVRLSQPAGRILDRVDPEIYPSSPACWSPGTSARVLFTGHDGRLFNWTFDGPLDRETRQNPAPVIWRTRLPRDEGVLLGDLCVPTDPELGSKVLVMLRPALGTVELGPTQLWWLELDSEATAIVRTGRLRPEGGEHPELSERLPSVARTTDGRLILAYLHEEPSRRTWQLRVAPMAIDEETGDPTVETAAERTLAKDCLPAAPAFSADARWVTGVLRADRPPRPLRRFAVGMEDPGPHRPCPTRSAQAPPHGNGPEGTPLRRRPIGR